MAGRPAEYEPTKGGRAYDVEVVSGAKVFDVKGNAENGPRHSLG